MIISSINLKVLRLLLSFPNREFSVREISRDLNVNPDTVYWIVKDLLFQGFVNCRSSHPRLYRVEVDLFDFSKFQGKVLKGRD